jgi:hypothetical protein
VSVVQSTGVIAASGRGAVPFCDGFAPWPESVRRGGAISLLFLDNLVVGHTRINQVAEGISWDKIPILSFWDLFMKRSGIHTHPRDFGPAPAGQECARVSGTLHNEQFHGFPRCESVEAKTKTNPYGS